MTKHSHKRLFVLLPALLLLLSGWLLLPGRIARADEVEVELGVIVYGDVNGDEDFDLKDISCLFRNVGCDYRDSWDFFPDGLISLKDVASLFYDYLDLHGA